MISVADIRERAVEWSLPEETVEKDCVIGWTLWGISRHPRLADGWVFKGGTCLKKCYIETYRFSEDLDFTVLPGGPISPEELYPIFQEILAGIYGESGVDYQPEPPRFKLTNRPFRPVYQVELTATGPLIAPSTPSRDISVASQRLPSKRRKPGGGTGPVYVVQCPICRRQFNRQEYNTALRPHKMKDGRIQCPGRTGFVVRTKPR